MKLEDMEKTVATKYDTNAIFAVLRYGIKNPSSVGIDGFPDIYNDVIEGLFRKMEFDFHNNTPKGETISKGLKDFKG